MGRRAAADAGGGTGLAPGGQPGLDHGPAGVGQVGWVGASAGQDTGVPWSHVVLPDAMSVDFDAKVNQTRSRDEKPRTWSDANALQVGDCTRLRR